MPQLFSHTPSPPRLLSEDTEKCSQAHDLCAAFLENTDLSMLSPIFEVIYKIITCFDYIGQNKNDIGSHIEQVVMLELRRLTRFLSCDEESFAKILAQKTNEDMLAEQKRAEAELSRGLDFWFTDLFFEHLLDEKAICFSAIIIRFLHLAPYLLSLYFLIFLV
ncbi:MAG: hypothetical protein AB7E30_11080 [Lawsonibacter sp.]